MSPAHKSVACANFALIFLALFWSSSANFINSAEELEDGGNQVQQGNSWSHWWSYDGISGPEYWNINKHWRLCAAGRKQSPVNIKTSRLVYDHLLGPIRLRWSERRGRPVKEREQTSASSSTNQRAVPVKLINSGRGIEVWLERASLIDSPSSARVSPSGEPGDHNGEQLILSRGPLSYEYKLFKMELHSASPSSARFAAGRGDDVRPDVSNEIDRDGDDEETETRAGSSASASLEEQAPEALRAAQSSEHLIDGRAFNAELQLHFFNRHLASSAHDALRQANEQPLASLFAVISVLISLRRHSRPNHDGDRLDGRNGAGDNDNDNNKTTAGDPLDFMLDNLDKLPNQGDSLDLKLSREQIESLLTDRSEYVTYQGSMTRPPCAESVDWIILNRPLRVDEAKFARLFASMTTNQENIRPIKQLNNRLLRTTINSARHGRPTSGGDHSGGAPNQTSCHKSKCANSAGLHKTHLPRAQIDHLGAASRPAASTNQQCDMKPNYVYQFTYDGRFGAGASVAM